MCMCTYVVLVVGVPAGVDLALAVGDLGDDTVGGDGRGARKGNGESLESHGKV